MLYTIPDYYKEFECIADKCEDTCCAGWQIVIDNFFIGNITDAALINSLSALELGKQYVVVTQKGCDAVRIEKEISISYLEKLLMKEVSETNRVKGSSLANDICKNYRREGVYFDEILDQAAGGKA